MLVEVARVGDVVAGGVILVQAGPEKLVLCNCDGKYYAVSRRCGHMNSPLDYGALDGTILTCPMHHVQFDVATGEALNPPIPEHRDDPPPESWMNWLRHLGLLMQHIEVCDVRTYQVEVEGGVIRVDLGMRKEGTMGIAEENMERMVALDDAWNAQDVDGVARFHKPDVVVYWPGQPPTRGMPDHRAEALAFFKTFPDQHLDNRPYKVLFASGDWTCSMARFKGTMKGPMRGPDGKEVPPTGKPFEVDFCTVAHWDKGQIVEEYLFYDLVTFMRQIGLG